MAKFTPQNAAENAAKSVAVRKQRAEQRANERENVQETSKTKPLVNDQFTSKALAHAQKQLEALDKRMASCTDDRAWDMLTRSKERIFKIVAHLAGIAGPGQHRPVTPKPRQRGSALTFAPSEIPDNPPESTP